MPQEHDVSFAADASIRSGLPHEKFTNSSIPDFFKSMAIPAATPAKAPLLRPQFGVSIISPKKHGNEIMMGQAALKHPVVMNGR